MVATNGTAPGAPRSGPGSSSRAGLFRTMAGFMLDRLGLAGRLGVAYDGARNLYTDLGYKRQLRYEDFLARYYRQDIAHAAVRAFPDDTWSQPPTVVEPHTSTTETPFEEAWATLARRLRIYYYLRRVDILAQLGHYAVLFLGVQSGGDLAQPMTALSGPEALLYLQPYSEVGALIDAFNTDTASADYGQPLRYRLQATPPMGDGAVRVSPGLVVHASRVLHVAEDLLEDDVYAVPRLQPVYNRLDDLEKVVGGGAEGYYRDNRRRIAVTTRDNFELDEADRVAYKEQVEKYGMGWTDFLTLHGMDVQEMRGQVSSPKEHFDVVMACICGYLGIPKSRLVGGERGTLASATEESQDYQERVGQRQVQYAEPLLRRLIDWGLQYGVLPEPGVPYEIHWATERALSAAVRAQVVKDTTTAIAQYEASRVGSLHAGVQPTVPHQEFRETVLNLPPESPYEEEMPDLLPLDQGTLPPGPGGTLPLPGAGPATQEEGGA